MYGHYVYFVDKEGREQGKRSIDRESMLGNWGVVHFRYHGIRMRQIPNSFPIKDRRIEVDFENVLEWEKRVLSERQ
jgi:hypothetical protein